MEKTKQRFFFVMVYILGFIIIFPQQVFAAASIEQNQSVRVTIRYEYDKEPISETAFDMYYVAEVSDSNEFILAEDFKDYPVVINGRDSSEWQETANRLYRYVQREHILPCSSKMTDQSGCAVFSTEGEGLRQGLYMIVGHAQTKGDYVYTPQTIMVSLPAYDFTEDSWSYDVSVEPKCSRNDKKTEDYNDSTKKNVQPKKENKSKLPQTGILWWPISTLSMIGMAFIIMGIWMIHREKRKEKF